MDNLIRDALYYTSKHSGASEEKAQGVVIGVVSALMARDSILFVDALAIVKDCLPADYRLGAIPKHWREAL